MLCNKLSLSPSDTSLLCHRSACTTSGLDSQLHQHFGRKPSLALTNSTGMPFSGVRMVSKLVCPPCSIIIVQYKHQMQQSAFDCLLIRQIPPVRQAIWQLYRALNLLSMPAVWNGLAALASYSQTSYALPGPGHECCCVGIDDDGRVASCSLPVRQSGPSLPINILSASTPFILSCVQLCRP